MTRIHNLLWTILVGATVLTLSACGGGGGGGAASGPSYTGVTAQATLDAVDAEPLVLDAYNGGEIGGGLSVTPFSLAGQNPAGKPLVLGAIIQRTALSLDWSTGPSTLEVIPAETGPCGGSLTGEVFQNGDGTSFSGYMTYAGYCSEGVVLDGTLAMSGSISGSGDVSISMSTAGLTTTSDVATYTVSGGVTMSFNTNQGGSQITLTMNMVLLDGSTGRNNWVNNYQMTTSSDVSGDTVTLSGRFYDFDRGYLDITTPTALQLDGFGVPQSGSLHFAGSNGTYADLTATGGGSYQLVVNGVITNPGGIF